MVYKVFALIGILSGTLHCVSGVNAKKLLYRDFKSAFFTLEESKLSVRDREVLSPPFFHPWENTAAENWKAVLGNLHFQKETSVGSMTFYIFAESELEDISRNLVPSLGRLKENQILIVVSKYNYLKGVVSRDLRTTFAIFKNKEGINLVFREIHAGLQDIDSKNYYEWSVVPEFLFLKNYEVTQIDKADYFHYKAVEGYENRLWIVIDEDTFRSVRFIPRKAEEPEAEFREFLERSERKKLDEKTQEKRPKSEIIIRRELLD